MPRVLSCNLGEVTCTKPRPSVSIHALIRRTRPLVARIASESPETAAAADPPAAAAVTVAVTVSMAGGIFFTSLSGQKCARRALVTRRVLRQSCYLVLAALAAAAA